MNTAKWRRIPVKHLRRMKSKLETMVADLEAYYPGICGEDDDHEICDPQMETVRNVATALAEIGGWITMRTQGHRNDPRE
jgi:hypothetical protein